MRILIVDGERSAREYVGGLAERLGYRVTLATTGREAMTLIAQRPFDIIMSSWETPSLSGPDLFRQARALSGSAFTYLMLLITHEELDRLETGLDAGADDYIIKPVDVHLLAVRLRLAERIIGLNANLTEQNRLLAESNGTLRSAHERFNDDFKAAARIQTSMLPKSQERIGRFALYSSLIPSSVVSGDTYNFFHIGEDRLALYAADVVGHGVRAALTSFMLSRLIDADSFIEAGQYALMAPDKLVQQLNQRFKSQDETAEYFTMICATIEGGVLKLCQAGHPSPVLMRNGLPPRALGGSGFPVGLLPEAAYDSQSVDLQPGDRLIVCSDGVTECASPSGILYGDQRLQEILERYRGESLGAMIQRLQDDLYAWRGSASFIDDVSILAVEMSQ